MATSPPLRLLSRRNFWLGQINGPATMLSMTLLNTETVLAAFVVSLMGGNVIWVGLLASLIACASLLPGVLLANRMAVAERRLPYYQFGAVLRTGSRILLALVLILGQGESRLATFVALAGSMLLWAVGAGVSLIPFWSVVSDSIPPRWRGRFFGSRNVIGGLLSVAGGLWLRQMLSPESGYSFPINFGYIALASAVAEALGTGAWCLTYEPPPPRQSRRLPLGLQLLRGPRLWRRDPNYRRLLRANVAYSIAMSFVVPFIVPLGLKQLDVAAAALGGFVVARQLAFSLSALVWSQISDQRGNRLLLIITASLALLIPAAMLLAPSLPRDPAWHWGGVAVNFPAIFLTGVFALVGAATGGLELAQNNYLLEVAPPRKRSTYLGFLYAVGVPLAWAPFVASLLIGPHDRFLLGFALSLAAVLVCLYNLLRLSEVREEEEPFARP